MSQPERLLSSAKIDLRRYENRIVSMLQILTNEHQVLRRLGALVDRGANGGIAGADTTLVYRTGSFLALSGIDNHTVRDLEIVHAAGVVKYHGGDVILMMRHFAYMPDGKTILSPIQMEQYGCTIHDKSPQGKKALQPYIQTPDGYKIPIRITDGLPYVNMRPAMKTDFDTLPITYITGSEQWDPCCLDTDIPTTWYGAQSDTVEKYYASQPFNVRGELKALEEWDNDEIPLREVEPSNGTITRRDIQVHLADIIKEELVDSVIEYQVEGEYLYHDVEPLDLECNWIRTNDSQWLCYEERQLRSSARKKSAAATKVADTVPTVRRSPRTPRQPVPSRTLPDTVPTVRRSPRTPRQSVPSGTLGGIRTSISNPDTEQARTDSNNKARSTTQEDLEERTLSSGPYIGKPKELDFRKLRRYFCGAPEKVVRKTVQNTTMMGVKGAIEGLRLYQHLKAPNPALNFTRRNEPVATDTVYGPVPAIGDGSTAAQLFVGRKSDHVAMEPCGGSDKQFPKTLMNHIRKYGAMDVLVSDNAAAQISDRVGEILRTLMIKDRQSEPHNKNQNYSERRWQDVKRMTEFLLNNVGAPASAWLLASEHVCFVLNHTASDKLGGRTPIEWLLGYTPDITALLQFLFWEPVYYRVHTEQFPEPSEAVGRFVGISETIGNSMSYRILAQSGKLITRSSVRSAVKDRLYRNIRAELEAPDMAPKETNATATVKGQAMRVLNPEETVETVDEEEDEEVKDPIRLRTLQEELGNGNKPLPEIDVMKLVGETFITLPNGDGVQSRAKITDINVDEDTAVDREEYLLKFKCEVGETVFEEIMTYNRMLEWVAESKDKDQYHQIEDIRDHRRVERRNKWDDHSSWEVNVGWKSGEAGWEPLNTVMEDDPITVSLYAEKNNLLQTPGWKRCKRYVKNKKILARMANQVKLRNYRNRPIYKYGVQVPRDHNEALWLDEKNGNTRWADAEKLEIQQLLSYHSFEDLGIGTPTPEGYQRIPCHFVYDQKVDGRAKARFVAGGHRTSTPTDSVYSGVVSLQGIRIVTFLAELNDLELWSTDVGNAYLESYTSEKVVFVAGKEFGELAGHTLLIKKAQYGLKTSGRCWHDKLHDVLRDMGFNPSKAEEDIWMQDKGDHYEYIAVYVDDLMIASRDPKAIISRLEAKPNSFKLKGTGPVTFHLGCDYFRDPDGTLCTGPKKYIERTMEEYKRMFGEYPSRRVSSPLEKGDHPEMDTSELLDEDGIRMYQSLIGTLQWTISLGRFDIATAVMSMSSFRVAPRKGHLDRLRRICGYLYKFKDGCIRVRTGIPDFTDLPSKEYDWERTVYGKVRELIPDDAPSPKGKRVVVTVYKDANLNHDLSTGKAVSGILMFINQTPVDWYSKKQATVETATYGSEFASAKTAVQQIAAFRTTLRYLGVPVSGPTYLFGDNESVVKSGSIPHSLLHKRHHALAYHKVREAIASGMVSFHHLPGVINPADILSKHWGHSCLYHQLLKPILFYFGDTLDLLDEAPPTGETL